MENTDVEPVRLVKVTPETRSKLFRELDAVVKSERMRQAFRIVMDNRPIVGIDCNDVHRRETGVDQAIHTYLDKLASAGWLQRIGRGFSTTTGKLGDLWDVTGVVGERISNYQHRRRRQEAARKGLAHGGDTIRGGRNIWVDVEVALKAHLNPKLSGSPDWTVEMFDRIVSDEIVALRDRLTTRANGLAVAVQNLPSRRRFLDACDALGIVPPSTGKPVDMVAARRKYHRLAREYHPEMHPGNEEQFRRVTTAFETIELYVYSQKTKST